MASAAPGLSESVAGGASRSAATPRKAARPRTVLRPWLRAQSINVRRHAAALRPFRPGEFGTGDAAPSEGHVHAVNSLMHSLRSELIKLSDGVTASVDAAVESPETS